MIDFEKLRKHTENVLAYEIDGEELFSIKPTVADRTAYLKLKKSAANKKSDDITPFVDFLYRLFVRDTPDINEEHKNIVRDFIENNIDELVLQTDIGFKLTTKAKMQEQEDKIFNALLEKNLV